MGDLYAEVGKPSQWCIVHMYADTSAIIGVWGPFPDEQSATEAQPALESVIEAGVWKLMPIRRVLAHKPAATPKPLVTRSGPGAGPST